MNTVLLLIASNVFMTTAWYWHLLAEKKQFALWAVIGMSWLIALPEYCLAVPANRLGSDRFGGSFTTPQLKLLQEGIALAVFIAMSAIFLKELPRWTDLVGIGLILAGLVVALYGPQWWGR